MVAPADIPTPDELDAHRQRVRAIIAEYRPPGEAREGHRAPTSDAEETALRSWHRTLYDTGLAGAGWPAEWGGTPGHHPLRDMVTMEELIRARAPRPIEQVQLASHLLIQFGTLAQKKRLLPRIRSATDIWCQLFSEPDAGSDLAGIKCRARKVEEDAFVLNGQKTWTSDGHWSDMGLALIRTGTGSSRHGTLTAFLVPMNAPGIVIRPIINIGGVHEFNEVYFDDAVLPMDAVLGPVGGGWQVAMAGLEAERVVIGANVVLLALLVDDLSCLAGHLSIDGIIALDRDDIRGAIAHLAADAEAASAFMGEYVEKAVIGSTEEGDAAIAKLLYTETYNRIARFGATMTTAHPVPGHPGAQLAARRLQDAWLFSRALTIAGGSSEIMRNIVARRRLRLPSA